MRLLRYLSIRGLLVIVVLLASVPSLSLVIWMNIDTGRQTMALVSRNALELAENLGVGQKIVDALLLSTLDYLVAEPAVKNLDQKNAVPLFKRELERTGMLHDILLVDAEGGVLFSANDSFSRSPYGEWISDAPVSEDLFLGTAVLETLDDGRTDLYLPYARTLETSGTTSSRYAVLLLLKSSYFEDFMERFLPPVDWSLGIVDASGTFVLLSSPGSVRDERRLGDKIYPLLWNRIEESGDAGFFEAVSSTGEERIFGYSKTRLSPTAPVHSVAVVSYLSSEILGNKRIFAVQTVFLVMIFALLGLLFALGVGGKLLVSPIGRLVVANRRFALGDLASRAGIRDGVQEIVLLSRSFDDMAAILEAQDQKRRLENEEIKEQAHKDYLTGTYNRRAGLMALERLLGEAKEHKAFLSIFFIDIDFFKSINDEYGHNEGDKMLKRVALLLERHLRARDVLCRYGGDEFLVILPGCTFEAAQDVWERIEKEIHRLNEGGKIPYTVSLSHGLAVFDGADPISIETLIGDADAKMYEEKARHKTVF